MWADLFPVGPEILAILVATALAAGWVDAVVGGGGLIQLPALLIGLPATTSTPAVLGTNKISSAAGTLMSSLTYVRRIKPDWRVLVPLVVAALAGAAAGSSLARMIPKAYLTPIVLVALVVVGGYTLFKPTLGMHHRPHPHGLGQWLRSGGLGAIVGLYDGLLGPGTGSFFVIGLVVLLGYGFLESSALAKLANLVTNLSSIVVFGIHGDLIWAVGLAMAAANLLGGLVGARMALRHGNAFIRKVFLFVIALLVVKLGYDTVVQFLA